MHAGNPSGDQLQLGIYGDLFSRMPACGELTEEQHYTASKMGCWTALNAAVWLCENGQIPGSPEQGKMERDTIHDWGSDNYRSEKRRAWVAQPRSEDIDTAVLLHAPSGFDRGKRMSSTIDAIRIDLSRGPLVYRYSQIVGEEEPSSPADSGWRLHWPSLDG